MYQAACLGWCSEQHYRPSLLSESLAGNTNEKQLQKAVRLPLEKALAPHSSPLAWKIPWSVATTESTTGKPSPTPARSQTPPRATRVHPAPAALPARFQLQWGPPRAQLLPPPTPSRPEPRPAPPGIAPPLARSRGVAHFHQGLLVHIPPLLSLASPSLTPSLLVGVFQSLPNTVSFQVNTLVCVSHKWGLPSRGAVRLYWTHTDGLWWSWTSSEVSSGQKTRWELFPGAAQNQGNNFDSMYKHD